MGVWEVSGTIGGGGGVHCAPLYFTEPNIPATNWRCIRKNRAMTGNVARTVATRITPKSGW